MFVLRWFWVCCYSIAAFLCLKITKKSMRPASDVEWLVTVDWASWGHKECPGPGCVGELQCWGVSLVSPWPGSCWTGPGCVGRPQLRRSDCWRWLSWPMQPPASSQGDRLWCPVRCAVPCRAVGGTKVKINLSGSLSSALLLPPWPPLGWARREHTARHGRGGRLPPAAFIVISANMCVWIPDWYRCIKDHSECDYWWVIDAIK